MNYFQPLAQAFGAIAQHQDFEELTGGRPPERAALLLLEDDFHAEQLTASWAAAFHLAYLTGQLEAFEASMKACGYFCAWAPSALPNTQFLQFLKFNSHDFSGRARAFFRLARSYSTATKLHVPNEDDADSILFLEQREKNLCQELAQRIIVDVGFGLKQVPHEHDDLYRMFVELFIGSFESEHVEFALASAMRSLKKHRSEDDIADSLEAIVDLLPKSTR